MLEWALIVICIASLAFVGCKGLDRLTGAGPDIKNESLSDVITKTIVSSIHVELVGVFTNDNFVEIKIAPDWDSPRMAVIIIRKGKKIEVNSYTKELDEEGHPYYMYSETGGLNFYNIQYGDQYQIFIYNDYN